MTAADRPSVTDNARAEAAAALRSTVDLDPRSDFDRGYAHGWHAAAEWAADRAETTTKTPPAEAGATADDAVEDAPGEQGGSSVPPCSPGGRAETTAEDYPDAEGLAALRENAETATTTTADKSVIERAATVITANTDEPMWSAVVIAKEMASCGLLATARTATTEDAVGELLERMSNAVTRLEALWDEHWDAPERQRLRGKVEGVKLAASYVEEARDLLATARTRPTREELAEAIMDSDTIPCDVCDDSRCHYCRSDALRKADAVLALLAGQPTEAEAGARALEQAAEWLRSDMDEPWGDRAANRLDVRAARIRAGGA